MTAKSTGASSAGTTGGDGTTAGTPPPDPNAPPASQTLSELLLACAPSAGNSIGVGKPCPQGSAQCSGKTPYCTGDYAAYRGLGSAVCTNFCVSDAGCGSGDGRCVQDPHNARIFICLPSSCIPADFVLPAPRPLSECLPNGGKGNSLGIGASCAVSFPDCNVAAGQGCTSSTANAPVNFCTNPCQANSDCYSAGAVADAVCLANPLSPGSGKACIPTACTP